MLRDTHRHRIEGALHAALAGAAADGCPPRLAQALRHAVFPGGARVRPRLCLAVAEACGDAAPALTDATAAAIELMHCASLVHDDLPCMDDAPSRRGLPSVHRAFDEATAVLVGDGLITLAFDTQLTAADRIGAPAAGAALGRLLARAVGSPSGLVAGQAWELEPEVSLLRYHRAKTAALFAAATAGGALSSGRQDPGWATFGQVLGEAYQIADDLADVIGDERLLGKPVRRDARKGRPNVAHSLGVEAATQLFAERVEHAVAAVPPTTRAADLEAWLRAELAPIAARVRAA